MVPKRVLITGGTGFVGKNLQKEFLSQLSGSNKYLTGNEGVITILNNNYEIYFPNSTQLNLLSENHTDLFFEQYRPEVTVNLSAYCGGIKKNMDHPMDMVHLNLKMAVNMYSAIRHFDIKNVYDAGSVCMYPLFCPTPFKEDDLLNGAEEPTNKFYGDAKRSLLSLHHAYQLEFGAKGIFFLPVNLYGPEDNWDLNDSHVIPALIRKFCVAKKNNLSTVNCFGTGTVTREFLYVKDFCKVLVKSVLGEYGYSKPINIGTGKSISIKDLACLISKLTGFKGDIVFTGEVSDGQPLRQLDVSRAKEILEFEAKTDLETGLKETIEWYLEKEENEQK